MSENYLKNFKLTYKLTRKKIIAFLYDFIYKITLKKITWNSNIFIKIELNKRI